MTGATAPTPLLWNDPAILEWCESEFRAVVDFARGSRVETGFGYMDADGVVDPEKPVELWISCRMTHVFALAAMKGIDGAAELARHGVRCLLGPLQDHEWTGWFSAIEQHADPQTGAGIPVGEGRKEAYAHAFVILAGASATAAGIEGGRELLDAALAKFEFSFWDDAVGRARESFDRRFATGEAYRGINANMHTCEAFLAAADITGDRTWLDRAAGIMEFAADQAAPRGWRLPEHYTMDWQVLEDYNENRPADPFRPFGVTPGHGLEWARLILQARGALAARAARGDGDGPGEWMLPAAEQLMTRAVEDGWDVDGAPGFVYTTDFSGTPVVRERMHWVLCEAVGVGIVAGRVLDATGDAEDAADAAGLSSHVGEWLAYGRRYLNEAPGRWIHELDASNAPSTRTWPGKPDAYHVAQMLLLPTMPVELSFAGALAQRPQA